MTEHDQDRNAVMKALRQEWVAAGTSTRELTVPDRERCEWAVRAAIQAAGRSTHSMLFVWVRSPMAGVLAAAAVGFALDEPMAGPINAQVSQMLTRGRPDARGVRTQVDAVVGRARTAIHRQVAAELAERGPAWERLRDEMNGHAWNRVWQTIGDPIYSQGWEQQARASAGLFEENLRPWATAMVDGQFGAGALAQLDAMHVLDDVDTSAFDGVRRVAQTCGWWWPHRVGAVLCDPPTRFDVDGRRVRLEFADGWAVRT